MNRYIQTLCALALIVCSQANGEAAGTKADIQSFLDFQKSVREKVVSGRYGEFRPEEVQRLDTAQSTIFNLLQGRDSIDELEEEERISLFNAQEDIQAVLRENDPGQMVCRREAVVGTHRRVTRCVTRRQLAEEQAAASGNLVIAARNPTRECMITRTCKQHPDLRFRGTP